MRILYWLALLPLKLSRQLPGGDLKNSKVAALPKLLRLTLCCRFNRTKLLSFPGGKKGFCVGALERWYGVITLFHTIYR